MSTALQTIRALLRLSSELFRLLLLDGRHSVVRWYALGLLAVTLWAGAAAFGYLFQTLYTPVRIPADIAVWPAHLRLDELDGQGDANTVPSAARAPLGHYHSVSPWFQPDPLNNCTSSGCHSPLPHSRNREIRAFANFHANFMSCELCHEPATPASERPGWLSMASRAPVEPPAALRLAHWTEQSDDQIQAKLVEVQAQVPALLKELQTVSGGDSVLGYLAVQLETSEPGSPMWRETFARLRQELPRHVRGDYGAKIAVHDPVRDRQRWALRDRYFATDGNDQLRAVLREQIHEGIALQAIGCQACHGGDPPCLDLVHLGYTPTYAQYLQGTPIAAMMQHIREGRPFYLPNLFEGEQ